MLYKKLLVLSRACEDLTKQFPLRTPEREVCGILCGRIDEKSAIVTRIRPIPNRSHRAHDFSVSTSDYRRTCRAAAEANEEPLAFYHSHQGSVKPSLRDRDLPAITGIPAVIFTIEDGRIYLCCFTVSKTYEGIREIPCSVVRGCPP
ncbi:MAG: hypothetical protein F4207_00855 [Gemmatimonadetes bacterium]|nr:hypothetical protein [Gemmatimonadota bacterium]MYA78564.1 hypothetical protein [Gemmatimonadota bacterium]MYG14962.1 hypothetical protein [Gemmatimonadota bacterium]MYH19721.1 hypothetical protein [Gemmatimonadota bacterium]